MSAVPKIRDDLPAEEMRAAIVGLEDAMFALPVEDQIEFETRHYFADGIYCREIVIPAGAVLTGKIHKTAHINIVSKGRIAVATEDGRKIIEAPCTFVAPPGTKRAGLALEETVWTTIHSTEETDLAKIEQQVIAQSFEEYQLFADERLQLESGRCSES